jgi:hypothetical protein
MSGVTLRSVQTKSSSITFLIFQFFVVDISVEMNDIKSRFFFLNNQLITVLQLTFIRIKPVFHERRTRNDVQIGAVLSRYSSCQLSNQNVNNLMEEKKNSLANAILLKIVEMMADFSNVSSKLRKCSRIAKLFENKQTKMPEIMVSI